MKVPTQAKKCRPYRKDNISGNNACHRGERELSLEVWVTKAEIYQGQAEVGKMISLQSEKGTTPLQPAWLHTHSHTHWLYPSILPSSPSVILKPATKASGLISSSPHHACKDLDPTQGRWDNIPLACLTATHPLTPLSLSLPRGFDEHKLNRLTDHRNAHTHRIPSFRPCVSVCVWWAVTCYRPLVSLQSGAAMLGQLWTTHRQTDRQACHPQAVIIHWLMRAQIMVTVWVSLWMNCVFWQVLTGLLYSVWFSVIEGGVRCLNAPIRTIRESDCVASGAREMSR